MKKLKECKDNGINCNEKPRKWRGTVSKLDAVIKDLQNVPVDDKFLIFCHFTAEVNMYSTALKDVGITNLILDGTVSSDERNQLVQSFNSDHQIRGLVIQIQTGGDWI